MATPSETFLTSITEANDADETSDIEVKTPVVAEPSAPTVTTVVAAPEPIPTVPQGPRVASFDDLTPDLPDLPPTRRGAPLRLLLEDRKNAIQQSIDAGTAKNAAEARALVLEETVKVLTRRFGESPPVAVVEPPPPETSIDGLRRRVDPASLQFDPDGVLAATIDAADERSLGYVSEAEKKLRADWDAKNAALDQRVAAIEEREDKLRTFNAYKTALPNRNPATDADLDDMSLIIESTNALAKANGQPPPLPPDDPESWRSAAARLDAIAARRTPSPPPVVQQQQQVTAPLPAPAPPVGSGAPAAAAPPAAVSSLPQHERVALEGMVDIFPQLRGKPEMVDEIASEVAANLAANQHPYSRRNVKRSATA